MPENLKDIKRRIKSVKNTKQITRAMKLVSGAKLRRAQLAVESARPFAQKLQDLVANLAAAGGTHPLLEPRAEVKKVGLLVISADRGLAGAFNANILKGAVRYLKEHKNQEVSLQVVGRKAADFFRRREQPVFRQRTDVMNRFGIELAEAISGELISDFLEGRLDAVDVLYTRFKSAMTQIVTIERLLPIQKPQSAVRDIDYRFDPSPDIILSELLPRYVRTQVYQELLETVASEHGARMSAMENATRNATEMISSLTLRFNRARQAAITREIIEIVSGAQALSA